MFSFTETNLCQKLYKSDKCISILFTTETAVSAHCAYVWLVCDSKHTCSGVQIEQSAADVLQSVNCLHQRPVVCCPTLYANGIIMLFRSINPPEPAA